MFASLEGDDYTITPFSVEAPASVTTTLGTECHSIALIPDVVLEANETILLQITTANPFVNFNINSAVVIIQDVVSATN